MVKFSIEVDIATQPSICQTFAYLYDMFDITHLTNPFDIPKLAFKLNLQEAYC